MQTAVVEVWCVEAMGRLLLFDEPGAARRLADDIRRQWGCWVGVWQL